mmetsp:Transcript_33612/g.81455  ORF Transcript_33612/g.81455 Transcript_33612/m.81455 type:complete len:334 (+) Transcript_33612:41-1042(+)
MSSEPPGREENEFSFRQQVTDTSSRFPVWVSLFVFSCVTMFSMVFHPRHLWTGAWGWAVAVTVMSLMCSFVGYMAYIRMRGIFMGQMPELYLSAFLLFLWLTGMWVIQNPNNNIAVGVSSIIDANVYFASWGAFLCSILLCGQAAQEIYGFDVVGRVSPLVKTRAGKWYMMVFSSAAVLVASVRAFLAESCNQDSMSMAPKCNQTKLAIATGVVGTIFAGALTGVTLKSGPLKLIYEWNAALVMVVISAFAIAYVTAGEGPGSSVGNLYFATWATFILSILIFTSCHMESIANREQPTAVGPSEDDNEADEDIELQEQPSSPRGDELPEIEDL